MTTRTLGWVLSAVGLLALDVAEAAADATTRGITVEVAGALNAAPESVALYQASYALVIGIDAYDNGWPRLRNAVADAEAVAGALREAGFDVTIATNLESDALRRTLKEFVIRKGADPEARLFLWYAGHGHSIGGEGFLVPADSPAPSDPDFALYSLPMRDVGTLMRLARAKHIMAVFDSCFAGTIFDTRSAPPPPAITRATLLPVRQFLSSGDADQTVSDDGSFRELFVRAVKGEDGSDANQDGYVTGSELGAFLADRVTNLTGGAQTPRYGKMLDVNFDRGDFVFVAAREAAPEPAATSSGAALPLAPDNTDAVYELAFWDAIKDSPNASDYEAYLEAYPDGRFAPLARARAAAPAPEIVIEAVTEPAPAEAASPPAEDATLALATPDEPPEPVAPAIEPIDADYTALRNANVRDSPGTDGARVDRLAAGQVVRVLGTVVGAPWLAVALDDNRVGYVHEDLLARGVVALEAEPEPSEPEPAAKEAVTSADNPFGATTEPAADAALSADNPFAGGTGTTGTTLSPDNPFATTDP